ncbi:MAG: DUF6677 family protein [Planctomycetota bacterium]|jgi:hypothetical protein
MDAKESEKTDPVTAVILAFLLPGGGHLYGGRFGKALFFFVLIMSTFFAGLLLSNFRAVSLKDQPYWFLGQVFTGLPALASAVFSPDWRSVRLGAAFEAGTLYTTVAGLMNLLVVLDAAFPANFRLLFNIEEGDREKDAEDLFDAFQERANATAVLAAFGSMSGALQILRSLSFAKATDEGVTLPREAAAAVYKAPSGALVVMGGGLTGEQRSEVVERFRKDARLMKVHSPEGKEEILKKPWWKR